MTQLDIPTISFTHYLDLLKRRTWHVVTMSILGLVVGGIVAMLVPRYYVASTTIELNRPILDPNMGVPADPMSQLVNAAKVTVPAGVAEAVRELGWPEARAGSAEDQRMYIAELKRHVFVHDILPSHQGRSIAHLMISYRDQNGARAAAMANELRRQWGNEVVSGLKEKADREILAVVERKRDAQADRRAAARQIQAFEEQHEINPDDFADPRNRGVSSQLSRATQDTERLIGDLESEINGLEKKIRARRATLDGLSPTIRAAVEDLLTDPVVRREYTRLTLGILELEQTVLNVTPAHPFYEPARLRLKSARAERAELEALAGGQSQDRPNPAYQALEREIDELRIDKSTKADRVIELQTRLARMHKRARDLPGIYLEYNDLRRRLAEIETEMERINKDLAEKRQLMGLLRPFRVLTEAHPPPAPTEPNPYMLALIGCIVGLAVAIGLVFLVDFLQLSFKSVSDVESGLGLPVLGTMSYLETEAEADLIRLRRRIATVFGVVFLVLVLTIVTIYYLDKTSLPAFVTTVLDMLLSEPK